MTTTPHGLVNPSEMAPAIGFTQVVVPVDGRTVYLAGQIAADPTGAIVGSNVTEQFDAALTNVVAGLRAVGGVPEHIVSLVVYTTAMDQYRADLKGVGAVYRRHLGRHFPAMAMLGVTELVEPAALVEVIATAVIPH